MLVQQYANQSILACLAGNVLQLVTTTTPAHARTDEVVLTVNVSIREGIRSAFTEFIQSIYHEEMFYFFHISLSFFFISVVLFASLNMYIASICTLFQY